MTTTTDNKLKIVRQIYILHEEDESIKEYVDFYGFSLSLSIVVSAGLVTELTERGVESITEAFDGFLEFLGIEDTGFESLYDFWGNDED